MQFLISELKFRLNSLPCVPSPLSVYLFKDTEQPIAKQQKVFLVEIAVKLVQYTLLLGAAMLLLKGASAAHL